MTVLEVRETVASTLDAVVTYEQAFASDGVPANKNVIEFLDETPRTWRELLTFLRNPRFENGIGLWLIAAHASDREILAELAKDADRFVRRNVAANANTPIDLLWTLSTDDESIVREAVANNQIATGSLLASLAPDFDEFVRAAVRNHRNTPPAAKAIVARRLRD